MVSIGGAVFRLVGGSFQIFVSLTTLSLLPAVKKERKQNYTLYNIIYSFLCFSISRKLKTTWQHCPRIINCREITSNDIHLTSTLALDLKTHIIDNFLVSSLSRWKRVVRLQKKNDHVASAIRTVATEVLGVIRGTVPLDIKCI